MYLQALAAIFRNHKMTSRKDITRKKEERTKQRNIGRESSNEVREFRLRAWRKNVASKNFETTTMKTAKDKSDARCGCDKEKARGTQKSVKFHTGSTRDIPV